MAALMHASSRKASGRRASCASGCRRTSNGRVSAGRSRGAGRGALNGYAIRGRGRYLFEIEADGEGRCANLGDLVHAISTVPQSDRTQPSLFLAHSAIRQAPWALVRSLSLSLTVLAVGSLGAPRQRAVAQATSRDGTLPPWWRAGAIRQETVLYSPCRPFGCSVNAITLGSRFLAKLLH